MVWPLWGCKNSDTIHTSDWKCQEVFLIENVKKASNFRKNLLPSTDLKWARMFSASWKATKLEKLCWRKESRRNYVFLPFFCWTKILLQFFDKPNVAGKEAMRTSIFGGIQRTLGLNPIPDLPRSSSDCILQQFINLLICCEENLIAFLWIRRWQCYIRKT